MVPIKGQWTPFQNLEDQLKHYRLWGLIPEKSVNLRPIMVTDGYFGIPQPCKVVGYQTDSWAVIELEDGFHAIHGDYLAELQPVANQKLPWGVCFVQILEKYVVIDIETTGFDFSRDRIIEIAAVKYEYGKKVAEFQSLVNPGMLLPSNIVALTGIKQIEVDGAPTIGAVGQQFLDFIEDLPLIGHNAISFDIPFLRARIGQFENTVIDTLHMARKVFDSLPNHKLEYLKETLQLTNCVSHRALQDVETTNALLWACLAPRRFEAKVWRELLYKCRTVSPITPKPKAKNASHAAAKPKFKKVDIKSIVATSGNIETTGPLFGKYIVFTGDLSLSREEAMQLAVNAGAILKSSVSRKTNYLVVGRQDKSLVGEDGMSSKEENAQALNASGKASIKIINEQEYLDLVRKKEAVV